MNYENLSKEELIKLLNKMNENHEHKYDFNINTTERKLIKKCVCGHVEEVSLSMIETPTHKHKFDYINVTSTYDDSDEQVPIKISICKDCGDTRIYLRDTTVTFDNIDDFELSPKYENKLKNKTQMYYPKNIMKVVKFFGPIKSGYSHEYAIYIKSIDNKWYKATNDMMKYINEHYKEWDDETEILFEVENKKIKI